MDIIRNQEDFVNKHGTGMASTMVSMVMYIRCYSHILCGGSAENFRFWWQTDRITRNPEADLQGPV